MLPQRNIFFKEEGRNMILGDPGLPAYQRKKI
jgi:hypothetical protein